MRRRLRKKRRVGEFREDAFPVAYTLHEGVSSDEADDFLASFLADAIEANGLLCGGGGRDASWSFFVTLAGRGSPRQHQRAAVGAWLGDQPQVVTHRVGEPFDAWYGPDPDEETLPTVTGRS